MHETAFDQLARTMRDRVSRRGMLRALAGGGLTLGLFGWTEVHDATAKNCKKITNKKKRKVCRKKAQGATDQLPAPPVACPAGTFALAGRCAPNCGATCEANAGICATTFEDFLYCSAPIVSCAAIPKDCSSHADCAAQELCSLAACGPNDSIVNRCGPLQA